MKKSIRTILASSLVVIASVTLFSCSNSNADNSSASANVSSTHRYGLNPMEPSDWAFVPSYHTNVADSIDVFSQLYFSIGYFLAMLILFIFSSTQPAIFLPNN